MFVDEGGGLVPRGSIGATASGVSPSGNRMAFVEGLFDSSFDPAFIMFPFRTRERDGGNSKVETTPVDYYIVLHNSNSGTLTRTVTVSKFTPDNGAFNTISTITMDGSGGDPIPRIGGDSITINAVQADKSLFIVSSNFAPHRFIEADSPSATSGTLEEIQFYKDTVGLVDLTKASPTINQNSVNTKTEFQWEYAINGASPASDLKYVRIGGVEYTVFSLTTAATMDITANWEPEEDVVDKLTLVGATPEGVQLQRRWPMDSQQNSFGDIINDGTFRPRVVAFSQGRLILGASLTYEVVGDENLVGGNRMWVSRAYDPFVIMPAYKYTVPADGAEITPSDAPIQVDLSLDAGDAFEWAIGTTQVYFGSTQSIYALTNTQNGIDAGGLVGAQKISGVGAKDVPVAERDGNPIYIANDSGGVMGARYDLLSQGFQRDDLTRHTKELASDLIDITYAAPKTDDRAERIWCVKDDGTAVVGGIFPDNDVTAWSRVTLSDESDLTVHGIKASSSGVFGVLRQGSASTKGAIIRLDQPLYKPATDATEYAVDMPIAATQGVSTWGVTDELYYSKTVACIAQIDGVWMHLGPVYLDGSGDMELNANSIGYIQDGLNYDYGIEWDDADVEDIVFAFPFQQTVKLFPQSSSDGRGFSIGRRTRILSLHVDLVDTRQASVEGRALFTNTLDAGEDPRSRTDWFRRRFVGREADRTLTIDSVTPYPMRLRAVVQEVSV
jgi:hypothetical protein